MLIYIHTLISFMASSVINRFLLISMGTKDSSAVFAILHHLLSHGWMVLIFDRKKCGRGGIFSQINCIKNCSNFNHTLGRWFVCSYHLNSFSKKWPNHGIKVGAATHMFKYTTHTCAQGGGGEGRVYPP